MASYKEVAEKLKVARNVVVLTGAGMGTESGIPDFRSSNGFYSNESTPENVFSKTFFHQKTEEFYKHFARYYEMLDAQPNEGHDILAKWEKEGVLRKIVTQNTDGLHQKAGNKEVIPFHGDMLTAMCQNPKCRKVYNTKEVIETEQYVCDCERGRKGKIKPGIVLFGEEVKGYKDIMTQCKKAEVILVLGTSLKVYPFANFVFETNEWDTEIVVINKEKLNFPRHKNTIQFNDSISKVLREIDRLM